MRRRSRRNIVNVLIQKIQFQLDKRKLMMIAGGVVLTAVIVLLIFLIPLRHAAEQGKMSFSVEAEGIVVRDEKLYQMDVNGKAELSVEEGQAVSKGEEIAVVYSVDYSEATLNDLKNCRAKIQDYLRNNLLKDVLNRDLSDMDAQINELTEQIHSMIQDENTGDLLRYEQELRKMMKERQTFLREQVNVDQQLQAYYDEETALLSRISGWQRSSTAEENGVVSFYFDGAESILTPDNMKKMSISELSNILSGKNYYTLTDSTTSRPLYRLVNQNLWYIMVISDSDIPEFHSPDMAFNVSFGGSETDRYTAHVSDIRRDGGKYIFYLEFHDDISDMIIARNVDMTISMDYVGILVPRRAIKKRGGVEGVYIRNESKKREFIPVEILINNDGYAIIQAVDLTDSLNYDSTLLY